MRETPKTSQNIFFKWVRTLSIYDLLLFGAILLFFIVASIYGAASFEQAELKEINGRFEQLTKHRIYKNIGHSYQLSLIESSQNYILKADFATCLDEKKFHALVQKGDSISIMVKEGNPVLIHSIRQKDKLVMDINCVHTKTTDISTYLPIFIALGVILLWRLQRKINQDRNSF